MNGTAFWNFTHGIGVILSKWTDELTMSQKAAICATWGDWTPNDVGLAAGDPHSDQAHSVHQTMLDLFWANERPIRTRVWEAPDTKLDFSAMLLIPKA